MIISGKWRGCPEKIFINLMSVSNEWINDVNTDNSAFNQRGMPVILVTLPSNTSQINPLILAPLGIAAAIGSAPYNEAYWRNCIGILESDLWVFAGHSSGGGKKSTREDIENVWILCQIYGHADRIWTNGEVTADHRWLRYSQNQSGMVAGATRTEVSRYPGLSGVVHVTVSGPNPTFYINLSGADTHAADGNINADTTWSPFGGAFARKPVARRDLLRDVTSGDTTVDQSPGQEETRPNPDYQFLAYHYLEDDAVIIVNPPDETTQVSTVSPASVTRGFVMSMGIAPKGV